MSYAFFLGIVQGLTEFLPVSSSGHLVIFAKILKGLPDLEEQIFFDAMLHLGTVVAVCIVFRHRIAEIIMKRDLPMVRNIVIAMVPTGVIALLFKDTFEGLFGSPVAVSVMLLVTGGVLLSTRKSGGGGGIGPVTALVIGAAQGLAIIPGISRSGVTIAAALLMGVKREEAGAFSFLLSVPAVLCAVLLKARDLFGGAGLAHFTWPQVLSGTAVSVVTGVLALLLLIRFVRQGRLHVFAYYCFAAGIIGILLFK